MKKFILSAVLSLAVCAGFAQQLPSVNIKDLNGKQINTASLNNGGKPMIINFWATWCKP